MSRALPRVALSINQPWAWLIAAGHKDIENRNWNTEFRGEFLIHAGRRVDRDAADDLAGGYHPVTGARTSFERVGDWPTGGMVAVAEIYGVVTKRTGGDGQLWFVGRYGFLIRNARPIEFIPCVGHLGFFEPNYSLTYAPKPEAKTRVVKPKPAPIPQGELFDG